ncbi:MAG TPA: phosphoribosylanthranilate isomerase [Longimicrobium sp.]
MEPTARPRIKVCCISSAEEAWIAIRAGASALGLVSAMPSGPGVIGDELIAEIAARVPPGVATFLLTSSTDPARIVSQQRGAQVNTLQLVDAVEPDALRELRAELPGVALVQVIHVRGPESVDEARRVAPLVHAILLDSGNPAAAVKELGGTGRVHDWELSRRIREAVDVPVYLAGGLRSENVAEAVGRVGPFGLDVCSGVRTDGRLDADKLARFVAAATLIPG